MKKTLVALALAGAFAAPVFAADAAPSEHTLTANVGFVSNYIFRGISQTQGKPALQGGFDYAHSSGLYAGTWASNVAWVRDGGFKSASSLEWDFYAGYKGSIADDLSFDVGVLQYYYPGDGLTNATTGTGMPNTDSTEVYAAVTWKFITLKDSYTVSPNLFGWTGTAGEKSRGSNYLDLTATYDLGDGWGVTGHIGRQTIKNFGAASYTDIKLGVTKDVGFGVVGLAYTDNNAKTCGDTVAAYCWNTKDVAKGAAVLSFNKTF